MPRESIPRPAAGPAAVLAAASTAAVALALAAAGRAAAQSSDWTPLGPDGASIVTIASSPVDSNLVLAGGFGVFFRSTDGGTTWARGGAGLPVPDVGAVRVTAAGTVIAGTYSGGVHRSTDGGVTFSSANMGLDPGTTAFVLAGDAQDRTWLGTLIGEIYVSTDAGASWEGRSNGLPGEQVLDILAAGGDSLYAATFGGVFMSTDAGASWSDRSSGLGSLEAVALARRPDGSRLYVATSAAPSDEGGVYRSTDGGVSWTLGAAGLSNTRLTDVVVDPFDPDVLLAATQSSQQFLASGIYRSTDGGVSWTLLAGGPPARDVRVLMHDGTEYMSGSASEATARGGLFRSADGITFARSDRGMRIMRCRALDSLPPGELLLGAASSFREPGGVYRSPDAGVTWGEYSNGALSPTISSLRIVTSTRRYAGTSNGVWLWDPAAGAWHQTSITSGAIPDLAASAFAVDSLRLWVASPNGVYFTGNGGTSFFPLNNGLTRLNVLALATHPLERDVVFAGTDSAGVFESSNAGQLWALASNGLGNFPVRDLVFDGTARLWAATDGGVYSLEDSLWVERNAGLTDLNVRGLAAFGEIRFAATPSGVFRHAGDPGESWTEWNAGLPTLDVRAVHVFAAAGRLNVFAGTEGRGVFMVDEVVPVRLLRLAVEAAPGRVELRFSLARDEDLLRIAVERRLSGETAFTERTGSDPLPGGREGRFVDEDDRLVPGLEVAYRLRAYDLRGGSELLAAPVRVTIPAAGGAPGATPVRLAVLPNPFRGEAEIHVAGAPGGLLRIHDVAGRCVRALPIALDGIVPWDGKSAAGAALPAGVYLFTLDGPNGTATARALKLEPGAARR